MQDGDKRTFLFLQGPAAPFLKQIAREITLRGHRALRINFCLGDWLFWRIGGDVNFTGRIEEWRGFVSKFYVDNAVTDIVLLGDCREYHSIAIAEAHAREIRVHVVELGYVRPDWLTVERDGMTSFSHFPRDAATILAMAETAPTPSLDQIYKSNFARMATWDVLYNLSNVFLSRLFYRHYRYYALYHPVVEYAGWLRKFARRRRERLHVREVFQKLKRTRPRYYFFPLQLATDFQIRTHSPFPNLEAAVEQAITSFARHAPPESRLVFKIHPMDNTWIDWRKLALTLGETLGCADRIDVLDGGRLETLIAYSEGVITINSTVGTAALRVGKPLIALGNAIFDVPGLTFQGSLDDFWTQASAPDPVLADAFIRVLVAKTQVRGGFFSWEGIAAGARGAADRILYDGEILPRIAPQDREVVYFRRAAE